MAIANKIKLSDGTVIDLASGGGSIPIASATTLGGVKVGNGLKIDTQGTLSVDVATGGEIDAFTIINLEEVGFENLFNKLVEVTEVHGEYRILKKPIVLTYNTNENIDNITQNNLCGLDDRFYIRIITGGMPMVMKVIATSPYIIPLQIGSDRSEWFNEEDPFRGPVPFTREVTYKEGIDFFDIKRITTSLNRCQFVVCLVNGETFRLPLIQTEDGEFIFQLPFFGYATTLVYRLTMGREKITFTAYVAEIK